MKQIRIFTFIYVWIVFSVNLFAQKLHSHNDYLQEKPFETAYELGFDSIEADLFLVENELLVAHTLKEIKPENTFKKLYLEPLISKIKANQGYPYPKKKHLQFLLDLKHNGKAILRLLEIQLKPFRKELKHVKIVISGDMPKPQEFENYDKIFVFDGRKNLDYTKKQWKRLGLMSVSFADFVRNWNGNESLNQEDYKKINEFVKEIHQKNKEIRFWGTPNTILAFETLKKLNADFIGADDLKLLKDFITN